VQTLPEELIRHVCSPDDLLRALDQNISGAAMDVTDPEPLTDDHPLFSHPNVIITPHISGNTQKESQHAVDLLLYNVERIRKGEDLVNVVDLEKGY
jgi:phosphoglycerate dehydrogenase-like enzyme